MIISIMQYYIINKPKSFFHKFRNSVRYVRQKIMDNLSFFFVWKNKCTMILFNLKVIINLDRIEITKVSYWISSNVSFIYFKFLISIFTVKLYNLVFWISLVYKFSKVYILKEEKLKAGQSGNVKENMHSFDPQYSKLLSFQI